MIRLKKYGLLALAALAAEIAVVAAALFLGVGSITKTKTVDVPQLTNTELLAQLGAPAAQQDGCPFTPDASALETFAYYDRNADAEHIRIIGICVAKVAPGPAG